MIARYSDDTHLYKCVCPRPQAIRGFSRRGIRNIVWDNEGDEFNPITRLRRRLETVCVCVCEVVNVPPHKVVRRSLVLICCIQRVTKATKSRRLADGQREMKTRWSGWRMDAAASVDLLWFAASQRWKVVNVEATVVVVRPVRIAS